MLEIETFTSLSSNSFRIIKTFKSLSGKLVPRILEPYKTKTIKFLLNFSFNCLSKSFPIYFNWELIMSFLKIPLNHFGSYQG